MRGSIHPEDRSGRRFAIISSYVPVLEHVSVTREILRPAKPRKPRIKSCEVCSDPYEVRRIGQRVCGDYKCAIELGKIIAQAAQLRKARKAKREWRKKTKSIGVLLREAQHEFNRYIRERDWDKPCISSGLMGPINPMESVKGHCWDAGHYRSVGAAPHLRFNEDNVHKQLVSENRDKSGNIVQYRKNLIERIGIERVETLENDNQTRKWDRDELIALRRKYLGMWKALVEQRKNACA